jgi:molecular chaperone DnaJ
MAKRDYYHVLGVPRQATVQEIRRAYRRLARQFSPDVNVWDDRAPGLFEEIDDAYRVLSDVSTRALYDRLGHRAFTPAEGAATSQRGDDLHYPIEIDFEEALRGIVAVLDVVRQDPCASCTGTGDVGGRPATRCPACGGRPVWIASRDGRPRAVRCEACRATGWRLPEPCPTCGGRGTVPAQARLEVAIPPGVDTGAQVRMPGEGHARQVPGGRGDLVVITRVRPHPFFTRKGDNLFCEVPITVPEAALGARIQVPTPDGPAVITVPSGTQSGQVFRLRGKGIRRLDRDGYGDLFVGARVVIPRNLDTTLEEVLRALQRLWPEDPRAALWSRPGATA